MISFSSSIESQPTQIVQQPLADINQPLEQQVKPPSLMEQTINNDVVSEGGEMKSEQQEQPQQQEGGQKPEQDSQEAATNSIPLKSYRKKFGKFAKNRPRQSKAEKINCESCNITLNSQMMYESHCKGAKHMKRLAHINAVLAHVINIIRHFLNNFLHILVD